MKRICDGKFACHQPHVIEEDTNAMRVVCEHCWQVKIIRKDPVKNVPENRSYSKFFKIHVLQGNDSLFYKYHPEHLGR